MGILVIGAAILGRIYEDELTQYVVSGLNKQIRAEAQVENVKLSFLKKFPDATLELKNVIIFSVPDYQPDDFPGKDTDTLLQAKRLRLRFNAAKLLKRQYMISEIHVFSGMMNLLVDQRGNPNYVIWKGEKEHEGENFLLDIENFKLTNISIRYENRALDMAFGGNIRKSTFKGNFSREEYRLTTAVEGMIYHYSKKGHPYFQDQKMATSASLYVNPQKIEILSGDLNLAGQRLAIKGNIIRPRPLEYDLLLTGTHLDLDRVLRFNLLKNLKIPDDMKAGGDITFQASVTGMASKQKCLESMPVSLWMKVG